MKQAITLLLILSTFIKPLLAEEGKRAQPIITAVDLSTFEGISWAKGRLPNEDGFRIQSAQVFVKEEEKKEKALLAPLEWAYDPHRFQDTGELFDPIGTLCLAAQPKPEGLKVSLIVRNRNGTHRAESVFETLKGYSVVMTKNFTHETGSTMDDYGYVVPFGDNEVFTIMNSEGSKKIITLKCEPVGVDND